MYFNQYFTNSFYLNVYSVITYLQYQLQNIWIIDISCLECCCSCVSVPESWLISYSSPSFPIFSLLSFFIVLFCFVFPENQSFLNSVGLFLFASQIALWKTKSLNQTAVDNREEEQMGNGGDHWVLVFSWVHFQTLHLFSLHSPDIKGGSNIRWVSV